MTPIACFLIAFERSEADGKPHIAVAQPPLGCRSACCAFKKGQGSRLATPLSTNFTKISSDSKAVLDEQDSISQGTRCAKRNTCWRNRKAGGKGDSKERKFIAGLWPTQWGQAPLD